jgi:hypothetical protein
VEPKPKPNERVQRRRRRKQRGCIDTASSWRIRVPTHTKGECDKRTSSNNGCQTLTRCLWTPECLAGRRHLLYCNSATTTTLAAVTTDWAAPTPPRRAVGRRLLDSAAHSSVQ